MTIAASLGAGCTTGQAAPGPSPSPSTQEMIDAEAAAHAAAGFAAAYLRRDIDAARWRASVAPWWSPSPR